MEFELTVKVRGESMFEVADKLTKVASDLLLARILQKGEELSNVELPPGAVISIKKDDAK